MLREEKSISTLGEFEVLVLAAILKGGDDAYGVVVHKNVEKFASRDVAQGAVYTTLMRLERKGLVKSCLGEATANRGGRAKRFYTVEAAGQKALRTTLKSMQNASQVID